MTSTEQNVNDISTALHNFGVSTDEAEKSLRNFASLIPPFTKEDVERIKMNPSLSIVAKIRIIRNMKKHMKGGTL